MAMATPEIAPAPWIVAAQDHRPGRLRQRAQEAAGREDHEARPYMTGFRPSRSEIQP